MQLASDHISILALHLLFSFAALLAGVILLVGGKDEGVWKLLMCGIVGIWFAIKVILFKYAKK